MDQLLDYDTYIVAFSGGKDSVACVLHLLESGVPPAQIELWHHDVDGREGSRLMDWPVTRDYCRKFAQALGLTIYYSWKVGGFEGEMNRAGTPTAPTVFETPDGLAQSGGKGKPGTRQKFPQVAADLSVRWCSAYLKIDVGGMALRNQARFKGQRVLFVSGERAQESPCRAKYKTQEPHKDTGAGRDITRWRPIHGWTEDQVWAIFERWNINPHPAYKLGWGRVSCAGCIFGSDSQWASLRAVNPAQFQGLAYYEAQWGRTIRRSMSIVQAADRGTPYAAISQDLVDQALADEYTQDVILAPGTWVAPAGAFGDTTGAI